MKKYGEQGASKGSKTPKSPPPAPLFGGGKGKKGK
jgi:hypothetical protein